MAPKLYRTMCGMVQTPRGWIWQGFFCVPVQVLLGVFQGVLTMAHLVLKRDLGLKLPKFRSQLQTMCPVPREPRTLSLSKMP